MIAQMKKLQILLPASDRDRFLDGLAEVGVVHVEERMVEETSPDLEAIAAKLRQFSSVHSVLKPLYNSSPKTAAAETITDATAVVTEYTRIDQKRSQLQQTVSQIDKDIQQLRPWGDFDPELLKHLSDTGVKITFHEMPVKQFRELPLNELPHGIISSGTTVRFVVFHYHEEPSSTLETVTVPLKSLAKLMKERERLIADSNAGDVALTEIAAGYPLLEDAVSQLQAKKRLAQARLSLEEGAGGALCACTGWIPKEHEKRTRAFLDSTIVWYEINSPAPDETPPVKLENGAFSAKFEPITRMFALPDYHEIDPTPFFAPFFTFFYGMCLGDVGYGALVFFAALVAMLKSTGTMKNIFILGMLLGGATIMNGFFLNSFFGAPLFNTPGTNGLAGGGGFIPFLGSRISEGKTVFPAMTFAVYIGVVQMLLGMLLQTINRFRARGFAHAVQPFCYLPLTVAAVIALCKVNFLDMGTYMINSIPVGPAIAAVPNKVLFGLLGFGGIPFIFLNSPTKAVWLRPLIFLWEFYNFVNSIVSYGLSYLRLFALGLAGGLLGNAFNQIALMLVTDSQGQIVISPLIIFTILIMIAGHALNFALSALGAYVHTVRLTFVEFYGALSFAGGGKPYSPLTGKTANNL